MRIMASFIIWDTNADCAKLPLSFCIFHSFLCHYSQQFCGIYNIIIFIEATYQKIENEKMEGFWINQMCRPISDPPIIFVLHPSL